MTHKKQKKVLVGIATLILGAPLAVQAGTVLRLRTGNIDTKSVQNSSILKNGTGAEGGQSNRQATEFIVQYKSLIQPQDRQFLTNRNIRVLGYLPEDAFVVRATPEQVSELIQSARIQGVIQYAPAFKLSPDLASRSVLTSQKMEAVVVKIFRAEEVKDLTFSILKVAPHASIRGVAGKLISVVVPQGSVPAIASLTGVEHIQPNPKMEIMYFDPKSEGHLEIQMTDAPSDVKGDCTELTGFESGTRVMQMERAWNEGFFGEGQIASVADTGVDSGDIGSIHKDFSNGVKSGFAMGLFGKSWGDPMGHGTHVAGSVLGRGTACGGKLQGSAPKAQLVAEGLWSDMMNNLGIPSPITTLFQKAYEEGARIHTNSWGSPQNLGVYDGFASQADEFMFGHPDMLILFAAGNSGIDKDRDGRIDPGSVSTPGTAKNVLTVGATKNLTTFGGIQKTLKELRGGADNWGTEPLASSKLSDNTLGLAMFSSRGPTQDGRLKPEIVAPGTNIISVRSQNPKASPMWGVYNKDYVYAGGTSMATPLTAGAATVVREVLQKKWSINNPSAAIVKGVMMHSAEDMFPGQFGAVGANKGQEILATRPNNDEGYGRVNMGNMMDLVAAKTHLVDNQTGLAQGEVETFTMEIQEGQSLVANMVYTDAPASPNAASTLVNDLEMALTKPDGSQVNSNDHVNNNEFMDLKNLPAGTYKLTIRAHRVPSGKQPYALVYTVK